MAFGPEGDHLASSVSAKLPSFGVLFFPDMPKLPIVVCRVEDLALRLPSAIQPAHLAQVNAWIGCCRTSHLHFDGLDNLLVVAHGRKEVVLFTPWQLADLYPQLAAEERTLLQEQAFVRAVSLGANTLRAETAAMAACALLSCR